MSDRPRHPKKEVEEALQYAESKAWHVIKSAGHGHSWGHADCPGPERIYIWSTPRDPQNHAKRIRQAVDNCQHHATEQREADNG